MYFLCLSRFADWRSSADILSVAVVTVAMSFPVNPVGSLVSQPKLVSLPQTQAIIQDIVGQLWHRRSKLVSHPWFIIRTIIIIIIIIIMKNFNQCNGLPWLKAPRTGATRTLTWIIRIHSCTYINTVTTTLCEAPAQLLQACPCCIAVKHLKFLSNFFVRCNCNLYYW